MVYLPFAFLAFFIVLSGGIKVKKGRSKGKVEEKNALWKNEYESELQNALLVNRGRDNTTRIAQSVPMNNEAVLEKLMETITSSESYLRKIENIDYRLNRLDIELHENWNNITSFLKEILRQNGLREGGSDQGTRELRDEIRQIQSLLEGNHAPHSNDVEASKYSGDSSLEGRLLDMENQMKSILSGVESIVGVIQEVKNRQSFKSPVNTELSIINEFRKTLSEQRLRRCDCSSFSSRMRVDRTERYPTDCHEIQTQGFNISGIYKIQPEDMEPFYVLCDLTTSAGGWTVFQNRFDGTQDFYKSWSDYKHGFGNLAGEFWLGLEKLHYLTNQKLYELRITMETQIGQEAFAGYSVFTVGPEHEGYRISTLGTFYGTAGDSLSYHAGQKFSTSDIDNDEWKKGACAIEHGGAWWYKECDKSNLNGKYMIASKETGGQSIYWISFKEPTSPLAKTRMMIRPLPASRPIEFLEQSRKSLENANIKPVPENIQRLSSQQSSYNTYKFDNSVRTNPFYT